VISAPHIQRRAGRFDSVFIETIVAVQPIIRGATAL
jgi:hypothetical protein